MAQRRKEEFHCDKAGGGCGGYFLTWLRDDMWGDYTIKCPNPKCIGPTPDNPGHHHYRVIKDGLVTQDRHQSRDGSETVLIGLLSTFIPEFNEKGERNSPWHDNPEFRRSQLKAYEGGGKRY